jgi:hypothetical protein
MPHLLKGKYFLYIPTIQTTFYDTKEEAVEELKAFLSTDHQLDPVMVSNCCWGKVMGGSHV